ncbi:hypothetical protein [Herpetosiphon sp. NSE202]|uniref:hypothetical protein n=1 Tax=Herpetosiphon sp. NSE202 TaxID=3351349 RepID=UPI0036387B31
MSQLEALVDTNVALVANRAASHASPQCVIAATRFLLQLQTDGMIVIDSAWQILNEYKHKLNPTGQPGVGDAFLRWVITNQRNPKHCRQIAITPLGDKQFAEFPHADPALANFDPSDRKFVAVAITDPQHPPIYNAVDSDWGKAGIAEALAQYAVRIEQLCPDFKPAREASG